MSKRGRTMNPFEQSEDLIVIKHVQACPQNLTNAFENAANELGRSVSSVSGRYYGYIKNNHTVLALATKQGVVLNNSKVVHRRDGDRELSEADIIELMQGMFRRLSTVGRKEALKNFLHL